ncbi:MAG TPA: gamma carbonic anhydrase family protein [Firmicutes bacterium]|nr:gamma carbonic anhydrase family protein [Bacillota bacterium]
MLFEFAGLRPVLHVTSFVAPGAKIIGDVFMDEYSSIWFNSVARGDFNKIIIGKHTNIQDNSVVHVDPDYPTEIGDYVLVGHNVILHGCRVESGCLVGMGAVLLNGCVIGQNSLIGAGSLVKEGQIIPPGVLAVGSPARIVRELKEKEIQLIRSATEEYSGKARQYKEGLKHLS